MPVGTIRPDGDTAPSDTPAAPAPTAARLSRGAELGRYIVLDWLGGGGMGVVYIAYDPELDRKLAVKLLRATSNTSEGKTRLMREAQAMARLSHPNVIAVHDVGTLGEEVFVAMEYVDGNTLAGWLRDGERTLEAKVDVFEQAGRGLAAAHAAGIVHRDFKPENVLVSRDGRVRVSDFGLARAASPESPAMVALAETAAGSGGALDAQLTRTGSLMGTPAYMAPEQFHGQATDERTDQFGYSVALYEALYGRRPFAGATVAELAFAVTAGEIEVPSESRVPEWIRRVVLRGLRPRPADRYPSMSELLADLHRRPVRRRWIAAAAAAFVVVAGSAFALHAARRDASLPCAGAEQRLAGVWDGARRRDMRAAFEASRLPYGAETLARAEQALDRYSASWVAMRADACEATRRRGEQSEDLMDLRMACLDRRLAGLSATTELLAHADAPVIAKAVAMAEALSPIADCANVEALRDPVRPPSDPASRGRIAAIETQLAAAKADEDAGRYAAGLPIAEAAAREARTIGYRPLEAEALTQLGDLQDETGDPKTAAVTLAEAAGAALASHSDGVLARSLTEAVWVVGYDLDRFDEARSLAHMATGVVDRLGGDERAAARLFKYEGMVLNSQGDYDRALDHARRGLALEQKLGMDTAASLNNIGLALQRKGDRVGAIASYREAIAAKEAAVGRWHPDVANPLNNLGLTLDELGRYEEALPPLERALEIRMKALGPSHTSLASSLDNLSVVLGHLHRYTEALEVATRSLEIREHNLGASHPLVATSSSDLGTVLLKLGRYGEAEARFRRALEIWEKSLGPDHADLAPALVGLGETLVREHRPADAIASLERAVLLLDSRAADTHALADTRFWLAHALWDSNGDRVRARKLAAEARDLQAAGTPGRAEIEGWLAAHEVP